MALITISLALVLIARHVTAQDCVRGNSDGADSLPSFLDPNNWNSIVRVNPIQVIIKSYEFHCCGKVGAWAAYVEPGGGSHTTAYSIKFQIWRPTSENSASYIKIGENSFFPATLTNSYIAATPLPNQQLDFQPGDVVGYYLQQDGGTNGGLQFDAGFTSEELWYATGNSDLQNDNSLEVGNAGDLSISASLGPIISISITTTVDCPSTSTMVLNPTYVATVTPLTVNEPTTIAVSATQGKIGISSETILPSSSDFGLQAESSSVSAPITTIGLPQPSSATLDNIGMTILLSSSDFGLQAESSSVSAPITTTGLPQPSSSPMNSPQVTPAVTTTQPQEVNVGLFAGIAVSVAVLVLLVILTAVMLLACVVKKKRENKRQRAEVPMIRNEAYVGVRQSSSDNGPSIPTTENEAYTSVTANTEAEEYYDYVV
ncbi:uncharacterized protein LOC135351663 isoform X1 [Halichondria panicea]|uniref:uncharacterized protein LOC135351663 isoform X1 n=1 Tax=Halichondria panicea TaxID=6063 RepID=UPI00312B3096